MTRSGRLSSTAEVEIGTVDPGPRLHTVIMRPRFCHGCRCTSRGSNVGLVPRGSSVSQADAELLGQLAESDCDVSPYQLEAWRRHRMLPRTERHGCGRGAGSSSRYPPSALPTALILAQEAAQGRSRHYGTMAVFAAETTKPGHLFVDETAVRTAITWFLRRTESSHRRAKENDPEDWLFKMADTARARTSAYDPAIIHLTPPTRPPKRKERDARAAARKQLANARSARTYVMLGNTSEISAGEFADAFDAEGWIDDEFREEMERIEIESGGQFLPPDDVAGSLLGPGTMVKALESMTFGQLCKGRDAFLFCCNANMMSILNMALSPDAYNFILDWRASEGGRLFGGICLWNPDHPVHLSGGAISCGLNADWAEAMLTYAMDLLVRQLPYMLEGMARAYVQNGTETAAELGLGLLRSTIDTTLKSEDPAWKRPGMAEAMRKLAQLVAQYRGHELDDRNNIIERLWGPSA